MDPMDHEADSGHNDNFNPGRADETGYSKLKSEMNYDKDNPWQTSMRGLAEGETLKASKIFRKNTDK